MKNFKLKSKKIITLLIANTIERMYYLSENNVLRKQNILLKRTLKYAVRYCPYYRKLNIGGRKLSIQDFPVVDKKIITENFSLFCSDKMEW